METQYSASLLSRVCFALTRRFNVIFISFNDVGYGKNTRKLPHALEIEENLVFYNHNLSNFCKLVRKDRFGVVMTISISENTPKRLHKYFFGLKSHIKCDNYHLGFFSVFLFC